MSTNHKYIECCCSCSEHTLRFSTIEGSDELEIYVETHLSKSRFLKRLWYGVKYIFGFQSAYGAFDETILTRVEAQELHQFLDSELSNERYIS